MSLETPIITEEPKRITLESLKDDDDEYFKFIQQMAKINQPESKKETYKPPPTTKLLDKLEDAKITNKQDESDAMEIADLVVDPENIKETQKYLLKKNKKQLITLLSVLGSLGALALTSTSVAILWAIISDAIKKADDREKQN